MIYSGEYAKEISFPIGGIGSGSFGIAGDGRFVDWEIFNRPCKGNKLGFTHLAVRARDKRGKTYFKLLNSDMDKELTGSFDKSNIHRGFGFGPLPETLAGLPHFRRVEFDGEFPIAKLTFWDDDFPCKVVLTAFNPFIPLDSENSSIPAGFFDIAFINDSDEELECTAFFSVTNPFDNSINETVEKNGKTVLRLSTDLDKSDIGYGDMSVVTDGTEQYIQRYWYRGAWKDNLDVFVSEILGGGPLMDRTYDTPGAKKDTATVETRIAVDARMSGHVRFVLSWNVPNAYNYWHEEESKTWKNYYATVYESSADSAVYSLENFDSLLARTLAFKNALFGTTVDPTIIEAVSSTMSVLKTATVLRLSDGSFYGWEGLNELIGSCEGTCQHVWNYAYTLCFLFPDLERSIRDNEFKYCMYENGRTAFRVSLPLGSPILGMLPCLDGQMGIVFKTYREWKLSGDTDWMRSNWENVKKVLNYAWNGDPFSLWDNDKDGVLDGRQHHTLDMELFGPSSWLEGMYLCALKAAREMADYLGDTEAAAEYGVLFENGYRWTRDNLFNGEYFIQKIDLKDHAYIDRFNCPNYWYEEAGELKYQIGDGCEIDQVLGQWHANLLGLGRIFDREQVRTALRSIYKYNFISMRDLANTWRMFSLNDERGVIMCSFPNGKPTIPIPYHPETMTGFEYALAALMISEGMEKEGLSIVKAIRNRYDGKKRNPWNEIECGSNYARAMASYSLLPIYSGFTFDLPNGMIGFDPIHKEGFKSFFSVGTAWGTLAFESDRASVRIEEGQLTLNRLGVNVLPKTVLVDGKPIEFTVDHGAVRFAEQIIHDRIELML